MHPHHTPGRLDSRVSSRWAWLGLVVILALTLALSASAELDPAFGDGGKVTTDFTGSVDQAHASVVQTDGKIILGGISYSNESYYDFALARYLPNGTLDTSFGGDGRVTTAFDSASGISQDWGLSLALQADGKILLGGYTYTYPGSDYMFALARYLPNGTLDASFGAGGKVTTDFGVPAAFGYSVAVQTDGMILLGGYSYNSGASFALARYLPNGTLDTSFDGDGKVTTAFGDEFAYGQSVAVQASGRIVLGGYSGNNFALACYLPNGELDTGFDADGKVTTDFTGSTDLGYSVAVQADGRILLGGVTGAAETNDFAMARYLPNGALDTSFDSDGRVTTDFTSGADSSQDYAQSIAVQADRKIILGGRRLGGSGDYEVAAARYLPNGALDAGFDSDGKFTLDIGDSGDYCYSVALDAEGNLLLGGHSFVSGDREYDFTLVRYLATPNTRTPVILVPGIGATALGDDPSKDPELDNEANVRHFEWPWEVIDILVQTGDPTRIQFNPDGTPRAGVSAALQSVGLLNTPGPDFWDLVYYLEAQGYTRDQDLFIFPYDWRYPVPRSAAALRERIAAVAANAPAGKVNLICHSMGGLVAKTAVLDPPTAAQVDRMVMLGTPHLGAPAAVQALRYGYNFGNGVIDPYLVKRGAHNVPGVYDLLPSDAYFGPGVHYFSDLADLDGNGQTGLLTTPDAMDTYLRFAREEVNPLKPEDPLPRQWANREELTRAREFHAELDAWVKPAGIRAYMIMGYNMPTPTFYRERRLADGPVEAFVRLSAAGDGTVPLRSGEGVLSQVDRFYWADCAANSVNHGTYGSSVPLQQLVQQLLEEDEAPPARPPFYVTSAATAAATGSVLTNWISLSPVTLEYQDQSGKHIGRNPDGTVEVQLPGANFQSIGQPDGTDTLAVPAGTVGKLVITPKQATGYFSLLQETVSPNGAVQRTTSYQHVPLAGVRQFLVVTTPQGVGSLQADTNGDGRGDRTIPGTTTAGEAPAVTFASLEADFQRALAERAFRSPGHGKMLLGLVQMARRLALLRNPRGARALLLTVAAQLQRQPDKVSPGWAEGLSAQTVLLLRTL